MKYRVAILTKGGEIKGESFEEKDKAEAYILEIDYKDGVKTAYIEDKETKLRTKLI